MGCGGMSCSIRPRDLGECRDTLALRNRFEAKKRALCSALESGRFKSTQLDEVRQFTLGRNDPVPNRFGESITQRMLREGIDAMEDLLESAGTVGRESVTV